MKIGLSYSKCVLDIIEGRVDMSDVLVIITGTDFNPTSDRDWQSIWKGYTSYRNWRAYDQTDYVSEQKFLAVTLDLFHSGKLHQPRQYAAGRVFRPPSGVHWLETVLVSGDLDNNASAKLAWDKFQTIAGLAQVEVSDHEAPKLLGPTMKLRGIP